MNLNPKPARSFARPLRLAHLSFLSLIALAFLNGSNAESSAEKPATISLGSLLDEMIDRSVIARWPGAKYSCRQASSYDRDSVSADDEGWFANWDRSQFIRTEEKDGRSEHVLLDAEGPGAVVRFWATWHGPGGTAFSDGTLRVYLDGEETPTLERRMSEFIDGGEAATHGLVGAPLSQGVSPKTKYAQRGHNLYLPIPYAKHCKITYSADVLIDRGGRKGEALYYQINYRTYDQDTQVETFDTSQLERMQAKIKTVQSRLLESGVTAAGLKTTTLSKKTLQPEGTETISLDGPAAINELSLKVSAADLPQALRSTVLQIKFDDESTVWCPVGDFFGIGYQVKPYKTWYTEVTPDGLMTCWWRMPFGESCEITVHNLGDQPVTIDRCTVLAGPWVWDDHSMHFHTCWRQYSEISTGIDKKMEKREGARDVNYISIKGRGIYVGDTLTVFNGTAAWWGEGDEKIYVDGEAFPSHFGTGTEDYYGYAWCRPESFSAPFHSQPEGGGNLAGGFSVNSRYRSLDAIPFDRLLTFDMELWHWRDTKVDYAPTTFWYAMPNATSNVEPNIESATRKVTLHVSQIVKPVFVEGAIEAETIRVIEKTGGNFQIQRISGYHWSNDAQLWWIDGKAGDRLTLDFPAPKSGTYKITAGFVHAPDYAIVKVSLNTSDGGTHDLYAPRVVNEPTVLGTFELDAISNKMSFTIAGANPKAIKRHMVGLDYLLLEPAE
ncbi:glycoside hydrolase family 172 protein [Novipirellula artificiosorum]|uniref:DUF2961 domain-containing protein n=1 Tax=Novipirellula artificiosorum TaxID=2528016 RepID=A0A5C6E1I8_9BACT|nr:glycoside hydrolase family 172 protein [Novipirellula artificiosorum]TWU40999.1 hypothetical protein Poly41_18340 [Novipirellula artificiosorum]